MEHGTASKAVLVERLREFDRIATTLGMSRPERLSVLNVEESVFLTFLGGRSVSGERVKPELERRLSYALPLMRRLAGNNPPGAPSRTFNDRCRVTA